ncbi:unnamed protein product [Chrysoparadoxa australica]
MGPVPVEDFEAKLAALTSEKAPKEVVSAQCKACRKVFHSQSLYEQHLLSKKHRQTVSKQEKQSGQVEHPVTAPEVVEIVELEEEEEEEEAEEDLEAFEVVSESGSEQEDEATDMEVCMCPSPLMHAFAHAYIHIQYRSTHMSVNHFQMGQKTAAPTPNFLAATLLTSFFPPSVHTYQANIHHMLLRHGFFIPDAEYLVDPAGLLEYCGAKVVKEGHICLYCNGKGKQFHSWRAVQQHMSDRAHCKLLYEDGEDLDEFEAFYDFSSTIEVLEEEEGIGGEDMEVEDGEVKSDEEEDAEVTRQLELTDLDELVVDGKTIGHRQWNRFYRQRVKGPEAESVLAVRSCHSPANLICSGTFTNTRSHTGLPQIILPPTFNLCQTISQKGNSAEDAFLLPFKRGGKSLVSSLSTFLFSSSLNFPIEDMYHSLPPLPPCKSPTLG